MSIKGSESGSHRSIVTFAPCSALIFAAAYTLWTQPVEAGTRNFCTMLSSSEVSAWVGKPMAVSPHQVNAPSIGCTWQAPDHRGGVLVVNAVPLRYAPTNAPPESKPIADVGQKAYTMNDGKGFRASAVKGDDEVTVYVEGLNANTSTAIAVLKAVLAKI